MVPLRSKEEIEMLKESASILTKIMNRLRASLKVGISTAEINVLAGELIRREDAVSAFKGYKGFPAEICTSINEEVVHGIPDERRLKEADIISLDVGINYKGYFSDAAFTVGLGKIDAKCKKLIEVTRDALLEGIKQARADNHLSDISSAIQRYVESNGFSVVRQFVGHGIGTRLHEEPEIPNFGQPHQGIMLKKGMVLAIEPMVNMGDWECEILDNGWTAVTKDRLPSAHFEHTVAITESGPEILTKYN